MPEAQHRPLLSSVRPPRVAVLVNAADKDWQHTCLRIIEWFTTLWGGKQNIIIPTDGTVISPLFWTILEAFDADIICAYEKTMGDLRWSQPEWFEAQLNKCYAESRRAGVQTASAELLDDLESQLNNVPIEPLAIAPGLQERIRTWLCPFFHGDSIVQRGWPTAEGAVHFPLTDVAAIVNSCSHATSVADVTSRVDGVPELWWATAIGKLRRKYVKVLAEKGVDVYPAEFDDSTSEDLFELTLMGSVQESPLKDYFRRRWFRCKRKRHVSHAGLLPFDLAMMQLQQYRSSAEWARAYRAPVVVGDTLDDYALYFCLSRMLPLVLWVLPSWIPSDSRRDFRLHHLASVLNKFSNGPLLEGGATFISLSADEEFLARAVTACRAMPMWPNNTSTTSRDDVARFFEAPGRCFEIDSAQVASTAVFVDDVMVGRFGTPKPKQFSKPAHGHQWIAEVAVDGFDFPRRPALVKTILREPRDYANGYARIARSGLSYVCPNFINFGGTVDERLVRPVLHAPSVEKVFATLLEDAGIDARPTDEGQYARAALQKWGGLAALSATLRDVKLRALLGLFLQPRPRDHNDGASPAFFVSNDQRWYARFQFIENTLGSATGATTLIDDWVGRGILHRGTTLKCGGCRNLAWFRIGEFGEEFRCPRCRKQQSVRRANWGPYPQPQWFYGLDEVVRQGLVSEIETPLLAMDFLRLRSRQNFHFMHAQRLTKREESEPWCELDILCLWDGKVVIGHSKHVAALGKVGSDALSGRTVNACRDVGMAIGADCIVFATREEEWSTGALNIMRNAIYDHPIQLMPLAYGALMLRPPAPGRSSLRRTQ